VSSVCFHWGLGQRLSSRSHSRAGQGERACVDRLNHCLLSYVCSLPLAHLLCAPSSVSHLSAVDADSFGLPRVQRARKAGAVKVKPDARGLHWSP
jgi:hypothetical protein